MAAATNSRAKLPRAELSQALGVAEGARARGTCKGDYWRKAARSHRRAFSGMPCVTLDFIQHQRRVHAQHWPWLREVHSSGHRILDRSRISTGVCARHPNSQTTRGRTAVVTSRRDPADAVRSVEEAARPLACDGTLLSYSLNSSSTHSCLLTASAWRVNKVPGAAQQRVLWAWPVRRWIASDDGPDAWPSTDSIPSHSSSQR